MLRRGLARSARLFSSNTSESLTASGVRESLTASGVRWSSTMTQKEHVVTGSAGKNDDGGSGNKDVTSYWGIKPEQVKKDDGTPWKWNCFRVCMYIIIIIICMFVLSLSIIII